MVNLAMDVNFSGNMQPLKGSVELKGFWDAVKKGLVTCALCWLLGFFFVLVPFANWTMPAVFWLFGPILGIAIYYKDRRFINRLDAEAECPNCKRPFEIHERDFAPPVYGNCPYCKAGYQVHMPQLEHRQ